MGKSLFNAKHTQSESAARDYLEQLRWPNGPVCPHCSATKIYRLKVKGTKREVLKCAKCRKQFSVTVGTIFEDSHIPLTSWLQAMQIMCSSKKGFSAHQLHRMLGITYKSAWFMAHRIRHAMAQPIFPDKLGGIVEVDETYIGNKADRGESKTRAHLTTVVSLVERNGRVRSLIMPKVTAKNLKDTIRAHVEPSAKLMTDSYNLYKGLDKDFASHDRLNHYHKEWVRGDAHTNTVEGYFSLLKRGLAGTYHHVSKHHLHRYLAEFDFRYSARKEDDAMRAVLAVKGTEGKRLQYQS
jgi:transposase-like protein